MATSLKTRTVLPCREFEPIEVSLEQLAFGGQLQIYPGVDKFFDIDYRSGRLVIASKSFVGLIPINDRISLRVLPRFPIENLFYILRRASARLSFIEGELREYKLLEEDDGDPLGLLARRFVDLIKPLLREGLALRYLPAPDPGIFRGSLDIPKTIAQHWSRGIRYSQEWHEDELTSNTPENSLIKSALERIISFYNEKNNIESRRFAAELNKASHLFDDISPLPLNHIVSEKEIHEFLNSIPGHRKDYAPIIWISYLLHTKRGIAVENTGGVKFDTFVVNLAEVFEDYVRAILYDDIHSPKNRTRVMNGNIDQVKLMQGAKTYHVKPDIYIQHHGSCALVVDAKYKLSVKAADRYEVLAFCEALQCKTAVLVSPKSDANDLVFLGQTPSGIRFWRAQIDLAAQDMQAEEARLLASLRDLTPSISLA